jgi:hypothetical protein
MCGTASFRYTGPNLGEAFGPEPLMGAGVEVAIRTIARGHCHHA